MNSTAPRRPRSSAPLRLLVLLGFLLPATGCVSTVVTTLDKGSTPYAGTQVTAAFLPELLTEAPPIGLLAAIDFLPTVALDTLMLPVTLTMSFAESRRQ